MNFWKRMFQAPKVAHSNQVNPNFIGDKDAIKRAKALLKQEGKRKEREQFKIDEETGTGVGLCTSIYDPNYD